MKMKLYRFSATAVLLAAGLAMVASPLAAATYTWSNTGTGLGNYWATPSNWSGTVPLSTDSIVLSNGGTIDLNGSQSIVNVGTTTATGVVGKITDGSLTFTGGMYVRSGTVDANLTNTPTGRLRFENTADSTVYFGGTNNLVYTGSGVLLGAAGAGRETVILTSAGALGTATGTKTAIYYGTLDLNGQTGVTSQGILLTFLVPGSRASLVNNSVAAASTATAISLSSADTTAFPTIGGSGDMTLSGVVANLNTLNPAASYGFNKIGAGTLTFSGANRYTGVTTVSDGVLSINSIVNGGLAPTLTTTANSATVTASSTAGLVVGQTVVNAKIPLGYTIASITDGTHFVLSSGTSVLAGTSVASNIGTANALGISTAADTNLVFNGGALQYTGATAASDRAFIINAGKTATIDVTTNGLTLAGATGTATNGALTKIGDGTLTLTGDNTYTGATTVSAGILDVTGSLANNGSDKVFVAANGTSFGGTLTRRVSGGSYAGFGSAVTSGELSTLADLKAGTPTGTPDISMAWRDRTTTEKAVGGAGGGLVSEVLSLTGATDTFALEMTYDPGQLSAIWGSGMTPYLAWLDSGVWKNAVAGNTGGTGTFQGDTPWTSSMVLGDYGYVSASNVAWAVVNHNSEFAVVPEPSTIVLLGCALIGLLAYAWRKRK